MSKLFVRLFQYNPVKDPTARLRVEYDPDFGNAILADEDTLPEHVTNPDARVKDSTSMQLTTTEVRWLATTLTELADQMEKQARHRERDEAMSHLVDMLVIEKDDDDEVYDLDLVKRTADDVIELVPGAGWLAIRIEDGCLSFIVVRFHSGPSTRDGVVVDGIKVERVFDGYGYHEVLRELRHTHWGESGYIYYPNGKIITAAFEALREWFDCD